MRWDLFEDKINLYLQKKWNKASSYIFNIYNKIIQFSLRKSKEATKIDFKKILLQAKESLYKTAHFIQFHSQSIPKKVKNKLKIINKDPKNYYALTAIVLFSFSATLSYKKYREIFPKKVPKRTLSSEQIMRRPAYYNNEKKLIKIYNINVPVLVDENKKTKSIIVDLSVQLSNRFSKEVLENLHHELNDSINMQTSPIVKDFPMTSEGKQILRNKLHSTLQILLEKKGIKAEVKKVYITSILSS